MSRFTVDDFGRRLFPKRGKPPVCMDPDYQPDPRDPFIHLPVLPECQFRVTQAIDCGNCRKYIEYQVCQHGFPIGLQECKGCVSGGRQAELLGSPK